MIRQLSSRVANYAATGIMLSKAGVSLRSILTLPVRRRFAKSGIRVDLCSGVSINAPVDEPLLQLFKEIWVERCYTPREFFASLAGPIVDIGANVGVFTLWAASTYPQASVIALEPSPLMFQFLQHNVSASRVGNVRALEAACGGHNGSAILYRRGIHAMNSLYARDNYRSSFEPIASVEVMSLDEVFDRFDVRECAFLKLDCEGAEYEILFNACDETLRRISAIAMEYHVGLSSHTPQELEMFLVTHGFQVERLPLLDEEGGYLYATRLG